MSSLKAELKRAFLQSIYDAVLSGTIQNDLTSGTDSDSIPITTLLQALQGFQRLGFSNLKGGKTLFQTAGLGHEVRWALPMVWRAFSEDEVFSMAQEFREVYDEAVLTLALAGNNSPNDATILATMMAADRMQSISSTQRDFLLLRWNQKF